MFFLTTMFGIIPGSVVYVNAGASLAAIESLGDVTSPRVLFSFGLLGLFALLPVFYDKLKKRIVQKISYYGIIGNSRIAALVGCP